MASNERASMTTEQLSNPDAHCLEADMHYRGICRKEKISEEHVCYGKVYLYQRTLTIIVYINE